MSELKHTDLNWREFGSQQLNVTRFFEWLDSKRLSIRTIPSIADYQFVQIEALLCTIERAAAPLDEESALADIEANPRLAENERASKIVPRWHIAADAHQQWRKLITKAIADGELVALDAGSKLPVTIVADIFSSERVDTESEKPVPRFQAQEAAILNAIKDAGYAPEGLPESEAGKSGVKSIVRNKLKGNPLFAGTTVFNKAWERLQNTKEIRTAPRKVSP